MRGFSEIDQVGRSRHHFMHHHRTHRHHTHAIHVHPIQWIEGHPLIMALVLAGAITLGIVALAKMANTGMRPEVLDKLYPAVHPYGPTY